VAAVVLLAALTGDPATPGQGSEKLPDLLAMSSAGSWGHLRPARTPDLCLTEGRERSGRYGSAVAVQLPCAEPGGPRTFLQPTGDDLTQIKWEHPVEKVMGCLTIRGGSPAKDMLEPEEDCRAQDDAQLFRIERFDGTAEATACGGRTPSCASASATTTPPAARKPSSNPAATSRPSASSSTWTADRPHAHVRVTFRPRAAATLAA
jgi:hypothetical protein